MRTNVALMLTLLLIPSPAEAWVYYVNNTGDLVHWPADGSCTIKFQYHPEGIESILGMQEFTIFEDAMDLWNANPCTDVRLELDGVDDSCKIFAMPGADQNCIVVSHDFWDHDNHGAAMLTILSYQPSTAYLQDVDIDINEIDRDFSLCEDGEAKPLVDYRYAAAHELGHVYGLDHPSPEECDATEPTPIMCSDGDIFCGDDNPHEPQPDDLAGICAVYDRTFYTCDDSPPEPEPEAEPEPDLLAEPNPEPFDVEGGGPKESCYCDMGTRSDTGAAFLLLFLALPIVLRRRRREV